jgi:hypothetical protein
MKRLFIVGCPRSGTTWTGMLLAQHPEVVVCQQLGVMPAIEFFSRWWSAGERKPEMRYITSRVRFGLEDAAPRYEGFMSREDMVRICRGVADAAYACATDDTPDCRVVVDKTAENVRHADVMVEILPEAYYLHVIRDPRSVFVSHRHGSRDFGATFPTDPTESALYWAKDVTRGRRFAELTPNYRELRYEALQTNGLAELTALLEWLGLTVDPAWMDAVLARTSIETLQKSQGTPKSFFRAGKTAAWRDELTTHELHLVEYSARAMMLALGYEPVLAHSDRKPLRLHAHDVLHGAVGRARRVGARIGAGIA